MKRTDNSGFIIKIDKLSKDDVVEVLRKNEKEKVQFLYEEVSNLEKGEGFKILKSEWANKSRSHPSNHFAHLNRIKLTVTTKSIGDYYLFIKL